MLSGVGQLAFRTKNVTASSIGHELGVAPLLLDFQLNTEDEDAREAQAWVDGRRITVATAQGDQRDRLVVSFQFLDWYHLQFARDEVAQTVTRTLPVFKQGRVPATTPFEIVDTDISASNAGAVVCSVQDRGSWGQAGYLARVGSAPTTARQFQVVSGSTKLVFNSAMAGASVTYLIDVQYTDIPSIGVAANPTRFGVLEFIGKGYGPQFPNGVLIHVPQLGRRSRPNLSTADDIPTLEFEFDCQVAPGNRAAVHYYLPAA